MVTSNYFWSMIICTLVIFAFGNISSIMRNLFILIMYAYSLTTLFTTFSGSYSILTDRVSLFSLNFAFTPQGFLFALINHAVFPLLYLDIMTDEGRRHQNSTSTLMFALFFALNILFFSSDIYTYFSVSAVTGIISMFLLIMNTRRSGINSFMYTELFADLLFAAAASLYRGHYSSEGASVIFYGALVLKSGALFGNRSFLRLMNECDARLASYFLISVLKGALFGAVVFRAEIQTQSFFLTGTFISFILMLISAVYISKAYISEDFRNSYSLALLGTASFQMSFALNPSFRANLFFTSAAGIASIFFALLMFEASVAEREVKSTLFKFAGGLKKRMKTSYYVSSFSALGASGMLPLTVAMPSLLSLRGAPDVFRISASVLSLVYSFYLSGLLMKTTLKIFSGEIKQYNLNVEEIRSKKDKVLFVLKISYIFLSVISPVLLFFALQNIFKISLSKGEALILTAVSAANLFFIAQIAAYETGRSRAAAIVLSSLEDFALKTFGRSGKMPDYIYVLLGRRYSATENVKTRMQRVSKFGYALPAAVVIILIIIFSLLTEGR